MDSLNYSDPREKIFVHTDKPYYRLKDTVWLKGYILTATEHMPNDSSRIAYVEVIDATGSVIKRINPPCLYGMFDSYIALPTPDFIQGQYLLRAYTRHMRNWGDSLFYTQPFTIIDPANDAWRATIQQLSFENGRLKLSARLSETQLSLTGKRPVNIRLRSKNKNLFKISLSPDASGKISTDTLLNNVNDQKLVIEITGDDNLHLSVPVTTQQNDSIDLRFFPEGGSFITGKEQRLGFKATNSRGQSIEVNGSIKNGKGISVATFASVHHGMGTVIFTPLEGENYFAALNDGRRFALPSAYSSGIIMSIQNTEADSIAVNMQCSADQVDRLVYFAVTCRGAVLARGKMRLKDKPYTVKLSRSILPSGIITCTVYNEQLQPINERVLWSWKKDDLRVAVTAHKAAYSQKDSVSLTIKVLDKDNQPVRGSFSMAVVDSSQVQSKQDQENLLSYMLLGSDIRGNIEEPYYYFKQPEQTEILMLTQGWVSYERSPQTLLYTYEKNFSISGKVTNVFNKPLSNTSITLFGKAGKGKAFLQDTISTSNGSFTFDQLPLYETDSISLVFKALNKKGKAFNVGITLDEPDYPVYDGKTFITSNTTLVMDTTIKKYIANQDSLVVQMKKDGTYLKEVIIKGRSLIPGSKNLNTDGGADQVITENTLAKTAKASLLDVLQAQVKGFRVGILPKGSMHRYMINSNMVRFIIDGVDLEFFVPFSSMSSSMDYLEYYKGQLSYFSAEDIKGIEVMNTPRYNGSYRTHFLDISEILSTGPAKIDFSFVEITTQTGAGPFMRKTPGMYLYKPVYPFISKQFYSPKYSSPDEPLPFPDFRSTVYWNPSIITDDKGEATVTFYTSESRSNYLILTQGTDLNGGIGVNYTPLLIKPLPTGRQAQRQKDSE